MGRGRLISTAFVARPRHEVNARACKITGNGTHQVTPAIIHLDEEERTGNAKPQQA